MRPAAFLALLALCTAPLAAQQATEDERRLTVTPGTMSFPPTPRHMVALQAGQVKDGAVDVNCVWFDREHSAGAGDLSSATRFSGAGIEKMTPGQTMTLYLGPETSATLALDGIEGRKVLFIYTIREDKGRFIVHQRSSADVPGFDGDLQLHIDDVTGGQVMVHVRTDEGRLLDPRSLRPDDDIKFNYDGQKVRIRLTRLQNFLVGDDFAEFQVTEIRGEKEELAPEEATAPAPVEDEPSAADAPAALSLRPGTSVTLGTGDQQFTVIVGPVADDQAMVGIVRAGGDWPAKPRLLKADGKIEFKAGGERYVLRVLDVAAEDEGQDGVTLRVLRLAD